VGRFFETQCILQERKHSDWRYCAADY